MTKHLDQIQGIIFDWEGTLSTSSGGVEIDVMVKHLARQGYQLAIASGKSPLGLMRALSDRDWTPYFSEVCSGEIFGAKPDPAMLHHILDLWQIPADQCLMVGDHPVDLKMAQTVQMPAIAVLTGLGALDAFAAYAPVAILHQVSDLPELLKS